MTNPTVSLCMIVRDEEELLPRCLAAAAGLWDELIVVDTGSRDGSVAIAEAAGAIVLHHVWADDFAAARNVGLERATGDWILFLDADELAQPGLAAELHAAVLDERLGAATLPMRNELPDGHARVAPLLRLFRREAGVRFHHRIHEEIATSVAASLARTGRYQGALSTEVLHLGYARARAAARDKKARDLALLEACVAEIPADFYSWFKLLELARFWKDAALGADKARGFLRALVAAGPRALAAAPFGGELVALAAAARSPDDPAASAQIMDAWDRNLLPSAAFHLRRGELAEQLGDARRATREFTRCLDLDGRAADRQLTTVRPLMGLARLALAVGDLQRAWTFTDRALGYNPSDPETALAAVTICRSLGGPKLLAELVAAYEQTHGDAAPVLRAAATTA